MLSQIFYLLIYSTWTLLIWWFRPKTDGHSRRPFIARERERERERPPMWPAAEEWAGAGGDGFWCLMCFELSPPTKYTWNASRWTELFFLKLRGKVTKLPRERESTYVFRCSSSSLPFPSYGGGILHGQCQDGIFISPCGNIALSRGVRGGGGRREKAKDL